MKIDFRRMTTEELKALSDRRDRKGYRKPTAWAAQEELYSRSNYGGYHSKVKCNYDVLVRQECGNRDVEFYFD